MPQTSGSWQCVEQVVTEQLFAARLPNDAMSVTINAIGEIRSIWLSPGGRMMDPEEITSAVARLHQQALADARRVVEAAINAIPDAQSHQVDPPVEYDQIKRRTSGPGIVDRGQ